MFGQNHLLDNRLENVTHELEKWYGVLREHRLQSQIHLQLTCTI